VGFSQVPEGLETLFLQASYIQKGSPGSASARGRGEHIGVYAVGNDVHLLPKLTELLSDLGSDGDNGTGRSQEVAEARLVKAQSVAGDEVGYFEVMGQHLGLLKQG